MLGEQDITLVTVHDPWEDKVLSLLMPSYVWGREFEGGQ